jgi:pentatricopeptide repeat protein
MLKKLSRDGPKPDVVTYTLFINNLCENGKYEEAREMFDFMVQYGPKPDIATCRCLLRDMLQMELYSLK